MSSPSPITAMFSFDRQTSYVSDDTNVNKHAQLTKIIKKPTVLMSIASLWPLQSCVRSDTVFALAVDDVSTGSILCNNNIDIVDQLGADYYNIRPVLVSTSSLRESVAFSELYRDVQRFSFVRYADD